MSKFHQILSKKIFLAIFLLAFPLFVVCLSSFFNNVQVLQHEKALQRTSSILNTTMQHVTYFLNAIETAASSNAWLLEENFYPESLQSISYRLVRNNNSVYSCTVSTEPDALPQSGRYFSVYTVNEGDTILTMLEPDFDYTYRTWYQAAIQSEKACWVDPFSDFREGSISTMDAIGSYSIPLRPHGNKIEGVVSTDFSFNRLEEIINDTELPYPSAYYMLLGADGRYLLHPQSNLLFRKTIFSDNDSIQNPDVITLGREMVSGKEGIMHVVKDGVKYHVCYAPVPGTNWSLALVCLDDEVLTDFYNLLYIIVAVVLVGMLFIIFLAFIVVRNNMRPLNRLLEATKKIANGQYDEVIERSNRKDIIAKLQNAFALMQESIVSRNESILRMTEQLNKENEELEQATLQAEKSLEEKRLFFRHVLRQIKTPLDVIDGLTHVMLDNIESRSNLGSVAETMKLNAARLIRRTYMLYDSSDKGTPDKEKYARNDEVSCNQIAKESIEHVRTLNPTMGSHFESELPDDVCIQTNHLYLKRSLCEIILNAVKFSDGKHITVRVTQTDTSVSFIIEDVGPGMPKDSQNLFTQPFMKFDMESRGLGVGLPLVKRHMSNLGGELILDTDYDQGCRIILVMPK
ncbi:MAG: sensor histidine kinase [Bacteroidaceae bacterium]|nr:sensor histidine kinase [Bacteroidaceae bacterium]